MTTKSDTQATDNAPDRATVEAVEQHIAVQMEQWLTKNYGKKRPEIGPGLRWLTGDGSTVEGWMDHPEYRILDGRRAFIGRPYQLHLKDIERVVQLAKEKNLDLLITSPSNYNRSTVFVILSEKEKK